MNMIAHVIRSTGECTHLTTHKQMKYFGRRPIRPRIGSASVFPHGDCKIPLLHEGSAVTKGTKCLDPKLRWSRWPIELMSNCRSSLGVFFFFFCCRVGFATGIFDFSWHNFGAYHGFLAAKYLANSKNSLKLEGFNACRASINQLLFMG